MGTSKGADEGRHLRRLHGFFGESKLKKKEMYQILITKMKYIF
jgi:hypothetical protein